MDGWLATLESVMLLAGSHYHKHVLIGSEIPSHSMATVICMIIDIDAVSFA